MTRLAIATLGLLMVVATGPGQERSSRLTKFESRNGKFRALMPRDRDIDQKELATGPGGVQAVPVTTIRSVGPSKGVYAVSYADYPETFRSVPARNLLDGVRDGLKGTDGKVVKDEETVLGTGDTKVIGREFRIEAGKNAIRARVFYVGNRLYQVMVTGTMSAVDEKHADDFLRSFELIR
jgi:hypothetical protein